MLRRETMIVLAWALGGVLAWGFVSGRWSPRSRETRRQALAAASVHPVMRIPVPWVFFLVYVLATAGELVLPLALVPIAFAGIAFGAGLVLIAIGAAIAFSALGIFKQRGTTTIPFQTPTNLVLSGPYRLSRNPMYLGLTLIYVGVAGTRLEAWPLLLLPLLLVYLDRVVIQVEERRLDQTFGEAYRVYRARVRRWL